MDFTIERYRDLLHALCQHKHHSIRHDVDLHPERALRVAQIEAAMNVRSTYYFRSMHFASHEAAIRAIAEFGHRVGYHYENLATCGGDMAAAFSDFKKNLETLRKIAPVEAICAHGSPRSPWNSQDLWCRYDYHDLGVTHEAMLDTDFSTTLYLTDTGHRWDGYKVSVRDKVPQYQAEWTRDGLAFHSTNDIIQALLNPQHPIHQKSLLVNTHPQRWVPFGVGWIKEFLWQNTKNVAKTLLIKTAR
ncbi:MAG: hypothetical protein IJ789_03950 [Bacteroidales bacterium]|nr:hypothetical protein [Bacteroidales bacterium]